MQPTKSRWSVVCGFSGEIYSGHRTLEMANKKAEETRQSFWWPNITGPYWQLECAIRQMRAKDPRYPKMTGKYLLPLAPFLDVRLDDSRYPVIMGKYRHSCGSLAGYVQVVPAGSVFPNELRWVAHANREGPSILDPSSIPTNEFHWIVPPESPSEYLAELKSLPDFEAAERARLAAEAEEEIRSHTFDDCRGTAAPPEHIAAMIREIDAARDADIPLNES